MPGARSDGSGVGVRRVLVLGGLGSGKTTLARALSGRLRLPHHELDRLAYDPPTGRPDAPFRQWTRVPDALRVERAEALAATGGWVVDGLYAGWTAALRNSADVIIWLDPPTRVTTWRVLRRAVEHRWHGGQDWDVRSAIRVAGGARSYRSRPPATAEQLRDRDGANGTRTLEEFLRMAMSKVVRCRTTGQVRRATEQLT